MHPVLERHRGPYTLAVTRPTRRGFATEWLSGLVDAEEVEDEARALVTDPRDTITHVSVWSEKENCYVLVVRRP